MFEDELCVEVKYSGLKVRSHHRSHSRGIITVMLDLATQLIEENTLYFHFQCHFLVIPVNTSQKSERREEENISIGRDPADRARVPLLHYSSSFAVFSCCGVSGRSYA